MKKVYKTNVIYIENLCCHCHLFLVYIDTSLGTQRCPWVTKVTPANYPHINDFTGKLYFPYLSRPTQLRISNPEWVSRVPQSKFKGNQARGS